MSVQERYVMVHVQLQGMQWRLEVYKTRHKGWAVRSWDVVGLLHHQPAYPCLAADLQQHRITEDLPILRRCLRLLLTVHL